MSYKVPAADVEEISRALRSLTPKADARRARRQADAVRARLQSLREYDLGIHNC